jgi:ankyrin repeat protein
MLLHADIFDTICFWCDDSESIMNILVSCRDIYRAINKVHLIKAKCRRLMLQYNSNVGHCLESTGNPSTVKMMLEQYHDIIRQQDLDRGLLGAVRLNSIESLKLLYTAGADVHTNDEEALIIACNYGDVFMVHQLFQYEINYWDYLDEAVCEAAESGSIAVLQYLLTFAEDELSMGDTLASKALIHVAGDGDMEVINFLLKNEADIDAEGGMPLIRASGRGQYEVVKILLESGATLENEALEVAVDEGHVDIVEYLLSYGADVTLYEPSCPLQRARLNFLVKYGIR